MNVRSKATGPVRACPLGCAESGVAILEAFAHGRPVVSTPMGIEGIEATPEMHYLAGDTAETFAAQCVRLLEDRDLGARLAERARCLVAERYSREQVMRVIAG